jgi:hypothetical protein
MFNVPPLAVVAAWVIITEFVVTAETYAITVAAAAVELDGENVQADEVVTPVIEAVSLVAVVRERLPRTYPHPVPSARHGSTLPTCRSPALKFHKALTVCGVTVNAAAVPKGS